VTAFLETARLVLRDFTESDIDAVFALHDDPEVMRFINGGKPADRDAIKARTLPQLLENFPVFNGGRACWAAHERTTDRFVGWFALRPVQPDSPTVADLGYRLSRDAWGRGYATEGARALVDKGFRDLGVRRIVADTMTVNARSRRVLEKAGLTLVRHFTIDWPDVIEGSDQGDVAYALTRDTWAAARQTEGMDRPYFRPNGMVLDSADPRGLADFYQRLLGWRRNADEPDWITLTPPEGGIGLSFQGEPNHVPPVWPAQDGDPRMQVHLDVEVRDLAEAVAWARNQGAALAEFQPQKDVRVMIDPAGHPFCLWQPEG
jgi:RimJ/RimL family protein N-acetyltransferase